MNIPKAFHISVPNDGRKKVVYHPNRPPEDFFTNVVRIKRHGLRGPETKGKYFIWDNRTNDDLVSYGEPTQLSLDIQEQILGGLFEGWEIIPWKDGRVLTLVKCVTADNIRFQSEVWCGLEIKEEVTA